MAPTWTTSGGIFGVANRGDGRQVGTFLLTPGSSDYATGGYSAATTIGSVMNVASGYRLKAHVQGGGAYRAEVDHATLSILYTEASADGGDFDEVAASSDMSSHPCIVEVVGLPN